MKIWLIATALLAPAVAHADQCQVLDEAMAARVRQILEHPHRLAELCEPCGEVVPGVPFLPKTVEVTNELIVDGKARDLAYTYVKTSPSSFENLAKMVGCTVRGVSPSLAIEAETEHGELITASAFPVAIRLGDVSKALPVPPPPPSPGPTFYSTTIVYSVPWVAIAALAGSGGFVLGLIAALVLLGARRRPRIVPNFADDLRR